MWQLYQYTSTIARFRIASAGAAVLHILKHGKRIAYNSMLLMAVYISNKSGSARVMFKFRPVKALVAISLIHNKN